MPSSAHTTRQAGSPAERATWIALAATTQTSSSTGAGTRTLARRDGRAATEGEEPMGRVVGPCAESHEAGPPHARSALTRAGGRS